MTEPTCIIPEALLLILKRKKGCSHIYNVLVKSKVRECNSLIKWKQCVEIEDKTWYSYCMIPVQSTMDISMRWFQYKILNRILYMKNSLLRFNLVTDKICTFCNNSEETIMHIFCNCPFVNMIWSKFEEWVFNKANIKIKLTNQNKLFGLIGSQNKALNCILIILRKEVFTAKCKNQVPSFEKIFSSVKNYYDMEKYIARTSLKENLFKKKWLHLKKCF